MSLATICLLLIPCVQLLKREFSTSHDPTTECSVMDRLRNPQRPRSVQDARPDPIPLGVGSDWGDEEESCELRHNIASILEVEKRRIECPCAIDVKVRAPRLRIVEGASPCELHARRQLLPHLIVGAPPLLFQVQFRHKIAVLPCSRRRQSASSLAKARITPATVRLLAASGLLPSRP